MSISVCSSTMFALRQLINGGHRHEKPVDNELSKQNMQDRYHGRNDPVARKIMGTHAKNQGLEPPEDTSIVCHDYIFVTF